MLLSVIMWQPGVVRPALSTGPDAFGGYLWALRPMQELTCYRTAAKFAKWTWRRYNFNSPAFVEQSEAVKCSLLTGES